MPILRLNDQLEFPDPEYAEYDGLLAVGGDLRVERLLLAYQMGIFPWYNCNEPILWWSPNPRFVLFPDDLKVSRSMRSVFKKKTFRITFDQAFEQVMIGCQQPRKREKGTWITEDMLRAYIALHKLGVAHSAEAWSGDSLVGGLYGVSLGRAFFGESMFQRESNASKAAFIRLVQFLKGRDFQLIDCQVPTKHLSSLGATAIPRTTFLQFLKQNRTRPTLVGDWEGDAFWLTL